jgi:hypothetical protein
MEFVVTTLICPGSGSRREMYGIKNKNVKKRQLFGPTDDVLLCPQK